MRYTRGVEAKGDMRGRLAELQIDKVAAQIDIPTKQLEDEEIAGDSRSQLRGELGGILGRCESGRSKGGGRSEETTLVELVRMGGDRSIMRRKLQSRNCEIAELDSQIHRGPMDLVANFESIPSAATGSGYH